jgi:hypothetical protein|tara:strand:+ start:1199 stop:1327 length:129 start_codon:yes stop_codon:yes gene_type:complete
MDNEIAWVIFFIINHQPIPIDMHTSLLSQGVDVSSLERKYQR